MSDDPLGYCERCRTDLIPVRLCRTMRGVEINLCEFCGNHTSADLPNGIEPHHIWMALASIWRLLKEASRER